MPGVIALTMFGGPADGRTLTAPREADYVDWTVTIGKPLFDKPGAQRIVHRYYINAVGNGTVACGLHVGVISRTSVDDSTHDDAQPA